MFTERFNKIMKTVGAKPTDIAGIIGCDRSAVDRICKGSRVPQNGEKFESVNAFIDELKNYIDYYNNERISLKLKGMSPVQYRTHSQTI